MKAEIERVRIAVDDNGKTTGNFILVGTDHVAARWSFVGLDPEWMANLANIIVFAAQNGRAEIIGQEHLCDGYEFPDDFGGRN